MSNHDIVSQVLDRLQPREIITEIEQALDREQRARGRFRQQLDPDMKSEFILGDVVVHSPALEGHNASVLRISTLLTIHCTLKDQGQVRVEKALVATQRNDFEPDVSVWLRERAKAFQPDMKYYPAPDLVVEVLSKSTEGRDRGVKYDDYLNEGVAEYWIVDYVNKRVEQYISGTSYGEERVYHKTVFEKEDTLTCRVLEGFSVPVAAFFYQAPFAEALAGRE